MKIRGNGNITVTGDHNHIVQYPTQQELHWQTRCEPITIKFCPSEKEYLEKLAQERHQPLSTMLYYMVKNYIEIEPGLQDLKAKLNEIVT